VVRKFARLIKRERKGFATNNRNIEKTVIRGDCVFVASFVRPGNGRVHLDSDQALTESEIANVDKRFSLDDSRGTFLRRFGGRLRRQRCFGRRAFFGDRGHRSHRGSIYYDTELGQYGWCAASAQLLPGLHRFELNFLVLR